MDFSSTPKWSSSICHRIACLIETVPFDILQYLDTITVAMDKCTRHHPGNPHLCSLCCLGIGGDRGQPRCHLRVRRVMGIVTSGEEGQGGIPEVSWLEKVPMFLHQQFLVRTGRVKLNSMQELIIFLSVF